MKKAKEYAQIRKLGHEAYSCDIEPCSGGHPEWHIQDDVLPLLNGNCDFKTVNGDMYHLIGKWDMIIAFPPCTYLSNAGARHLYKGGKLNKERYKKGLEGKELFMAIYNADCPKICIENPTPSKIYELPKKTQVIQPYQFGHPFTKRTQLWLKGLPLLQPTKIVQVKASCRTADWFNKGGKNRQLNRSKTFPGIAKAMAEQWTTLKGGV